MVGRLLAAPSVASSPPIGSGQIVYLTATARVARKWLTCILVVTECDLPKDKNHRKPLPNQTPNPTPVSLRDTTDALTSFLEHCDRTDQLFS